MPLNTKHTPHKPKRSGVLVTIVTTLLTAVAIASCALIALVSLSPEHAKRELGTAISQVERVTSTLGITQQSIQLGPRGNQSDVDRCTGQWIQMEEYDADFPNIPVYAVHNGCGGNALLSLTTSDSITIIKQDGSEGEYRMKSEKVIPQQRSTTADLAGLSGEFLLQTCYWDDTSMRIVGMTPVSNN